MEYKYKKLTPFKMQCLTNFPFIDEDFDALSNYGLLCKIVEYVNNISTNNNLLIDNINDLNNWFNNLDVTDEINNKLDEMVADGTLENIINNELFSTLNDKINANENNINNLNDKINGFNKLKNKRYIMIGDSYVTGSLNGEMYATDGWAKRIKSMMGLSDDNCYIFGDGGAGFTHNGHLGFNFISLLTANLDNILNKETIDYVIVCGGYNDKDSNVNAIESMISQLTTLVKNNFSNAKLYIGCIGTTSLIDSTGKNIRSNINHISLVAYKNCIKYGAYYLNGVESILKDYSLMGTDFYHPSIEGYNNLAFGIIQCLETGYYSKITEVKNITLTPLEENTFTTGPTSAYCKITNDTLLILINTILYFTNDIDFTTGNEIKLLKIESDLIRKNYSADLWLTGAYVTIGSSRMKCRGYLYINDDNELVLKIDEYPDGVTVGKTLNIRISNHFNIND